MILLICSLLLLVGLAEGLFSWHQVSLILEDQIGHRALRVSQAVALIPAVRQELEKGDMHSLRLQAIAETIRLQTGALFVVIGDSQGRRYTHPVEERIGQQMVGGDNDLPLALGLAEISKAKGTMGYSIRGKTPVFNDDHEVIGVVSVGYLMENVNRTIRRNQFNIVLVLLAALILGTGLTIKITNDLRAALFGLEPEDIAALLKERTATLEAIREGVMAIDRHGLVTTINHAAIKTLGVDNSREIIGRPVKEIFPATRMLDVLTSGDSQLDRIQQYNDKEIVINRIPIVIGDKVVGVVSSFRDLSELNLVLKKLSKVQEYSEMLRAQTHEYSNKLHTISGLIQIEAFKEAIELIGSETSGYQDLIHSLMTIAPDPVLAGMLLGKYNTAMERKIRMVIDPDSSMRDIPATVEVEQLVTIVGNILDNGFDAVVRQNEENREVRLSMTDLGHDLIFEIDDSGPGLAPEQYRQIFTRGYTTKNKEGHGVGLYLVEKTVTKMGGTIHVGPSELGGAAFTVILPKGKQHGERHDPDPYRRG
ncbi:MAG: ATP-binding protein [Desulfopila sp.]